MSQQAHRRVISATFHQIDGWEVVEPSPSEPTTLPAATTTLSNTEVLN